VNRHEIAVALIILGAALVITAGTGPEETDYTVNTTETVDGDTIDVNGDITATVRLLGVDTPETQTSNNPDEFGLQDTLQNRECLQKWGERASEFTANFTSNSEISLETDPGADRRGDYGRLLAYVEKNSETLGERLLEEGYARVYESEFTRLEEYRKIESKARSENQGLWQCS
jgi:micrococcal nuclease